MRSEAFYSEIDRHRVPMEREVVIALANSPGVLDFYLWIAGRVGYSRLEKFACLSFRLVVSGTNSVAGFIHKTDSFAGRLSSGSASSVLIGLGVQPRFPRMAKI
jgi:hypothetical protein